MKKFNPEFLVLLILTTIIFTVLWITHLIPLSGSVEVITKIGKYNLETHQTLYDSKVLFWRRFNIVYSNYSYDKDSTVNANFIKEELMKCEEIKKELNK